MKTRKRALYKMKVLVTGANGMLGQDLCPILEDAGCYVIQTDYETLDVTDNTAADNFISKTHPDLIIHCAAYTNVDKAESDIEKATLLNAKGTENMALAASKIDVPIIYISTDYVFDGTKNTPYLPDDTPNPKSIYGKTKYEGELAIKKHCKKYYIARTSWLYGIHGKNFVETMLTLAGAPSGGVTSASDELDDGNTTPDASTTLASAGAPGTTPALAGAGNPSTTQASSDTANNKTGTPSAAKEIKVVDDQTGCPTWSVDLCYGILKLLTKPYGTYHLCGADKTSWYGFAKKIFELENLDVNLTPCTTEEFPRPAKRPKYSVMGNNNLLRPWQEALACYLKLRKENLE